jgi:hypothetical protein
MIFLSAVLKGVEGEVGQPGDVALGREHAEDATLVARPVPEIEVSVHRAESSRVTTG